MAQRGMNEVESLRQRLANYQRTRALAPRSLWQWCDLLIREAEDALQALPQDAAVCVHSEVQQAIAASEMAAAEIARLRSTYPFCA